MLHRIIMPAILLSAIASTAADNYDTLTHSVVRCIANRDFAGLVVLLPDKSFRYCIADASTGAKPGEANKNFVLQQDGYYPFEKKLSAVSAKDAASSLTSDCGPAFNRAKYPVAETDFSQVNIEGRNRVEIVAKKFCTAQGAHLVFVKNKKNVWGFAGIWWEKPRTE